MIFLNLLSEVSTWSAILPPPDPFKYQLSLDLSTQHAVSMPYKSYIS